MDRGAQRMYRRRLMRGLTRVVGGVNRGGDGVLRRWGELMDRGGHVGCLAVVAWRGGRGRNRVLHRWAGRVDGMRRVRGFVVVIRGVDAQREGRDLYDRPRRSCGGGGVRRRWGRLCGVEDGTRA